MERYAADLAAEARSGVRPACRHDFRYPAKADMVRLGSHVAVLPKPEIWPIGCKMLVEVALTCS